MMPAGHWSGRRRKKYAQPNQWVLIKLRVIKMVKICLAHSVAGNIDNLMMGLAL